MTQRQIFHAEANQVVKAFTLEHSEFDVYKEQPNYRGGTNCISFGTLDGEEIVYKYFCTEGRYQHELACLKHFAHIGLIPKILHTEHRLIVMTRLPGASISRTLSDPTLTDKERSQISQSFGNGVGQLTMIPLPEQNEGYSILTDMDINVPWGLDLKQVIHRYLQFSYQALKSVPAYTDSLFAESTHFLEAQTESVTEAKKILYHEDIGNTMVNRTELVGFFDLEMCRFGSEHMQIGLMLETGTNNRLNWHSVLEGYQTTVGRTLNDDDLYASLAMCHFYHHQRAWDEHQDTEEQKIQSAQESAPEILQYLRKSCLLWKEHIDLSKWFPSMYTH